MAIWTAASGTAICLAVVLLGCSATPHLARSKLEPTLSAAGFELLKRAEKGFEILKQAKKKS